MIKYKIKKKKGGTAKGSFTGGTIDWVVKGGSTPSEQKVVTSRTKGAGGGGQRAATRVCQERRRGKQKRPKQIKVRDNSQKGSPKSKKGKTGGEYGRVGEKKKGP